MNKPITRNPKGGYIVDDEVTANLFGNGTYIPTIDRVMFNSGKRTTKFHMEKQPDGTEKKIVDETQPTLTTVLYWKDGTKTVVLNSENDPVEFGSDGKPTKAARERGVVYAIVKRLIGCYGHDEKGRMTLKSEGFGRILNKLVDEAYDCQAEKAKREQKKLEAKKAYENRKGTAKKARPSIAQCAIDLSESAKELKEAIAVLKADLQVAQAVR